MGAERTGVLNEHEEDVYLSLHLNPAVKKSPIHAVVFPGQGSQTPGMLLDLEREFPIIRNTLDEASSVLGFDLYQLITEGTRAQLADTRVTQPLMLASDVAVWRAWCEVAPVYPKYMAGHSLGEYSALVCSGAMSFQDALNTVMVRAEAMVSAVPEGDGAMAAVLGLASDIVGELCKTASEQGVGTVSCANFNAPSQIVVGGDIKAVHALEKLAKEAGARRVIPVAMSVPSHCALMKPAADQLEEYLRQVNVGEPLFSLINNAHLEIEKDSQAIKSALVEQVYRPVDWVGIVKAMIQRGVSYIAECGPGKVLSGLNKRIDKTVSVYPLGDSTSFGKARVEFDRFVDLSDV